MAHMRVFATRMVAYHVETDCGVEVVAAEDCGEFDPSYEHSAPERQRAIRDQIAPYLEGTRIESIERREGWYARLSAPGYLDCTGWTGPFASQAAAVKDCCDTYDCDENGDDRSDA